MQWQQNYGSQGSGSQVVSKQQQNSASNGHATANYTLPGVINYLTSEFTNLERFKIMTKLEMSEMKYKIIELQSEVNSLKFVNEKQSTKIKLLETENKRLKGDSSKEAGSDEHNDNSFSDTEIPEIDLSAIKNSRHQLTKSMREIMQLLRTPIANFSNTLNIPDSNSDEFAELIHDNPADSFIFQDSNEFKSRSPDKLKSIFSQYLTQEDLLKEDQTANWEQSYKDAEHSKSLDPLEADGSGKEKKNIKTNSYESDTETVIYEEPEPMEAVNPIASITYVDEKYDEQKLFTLGVYVTSINYNSEGDEVKINVSFMEDTCYAKILPTSSLPDPANIKDIYPIVTTGNTVNHILILYKTGAAYSLQTKTDEVHTVDLGIGKFAKAVLSSDFVNLEHGSTSSNGNCGLVVSCEGDSSSFFNIYVVSAYSDSAQVTVKEIGHYKRLFFKSVVKPLASDKFEFVKWLQIIDPPANLTAEDNEDSESVAINTLLGSFGIVLKLNSSIIKLNLKLKKFDLIFSSSSLQNSAALQVVDGHCLFIEEGPNNSHVAKLFNLSEKILLSQSHYTHSNIILIKTSSELRILEIESDSFSVLDTTFSALSRYKSTFAVKPFSSAGNIVCLVSDRDLQIFDTNTWM